MSRLKELFPGLKCISLQFWFRIALNMTLTDDMQKMFTPSQWADTVSKTNNVVWNFFLLHK